MGWSGRQKGVMTASSGMTSENAGGSPGTGQGGGDAVRIARRASSHRQRVDHQATPGGSATKPQGPGHSSQDSPTSCTTSGNTNRPSSGTRSPWPSIRTTSTPARTWERHTITPARAAQALKEYSQSLAIDPDHKPTLLNVIVVNLEGTHDIAAARTGVGPPAQSGSGESSSSKLEAEVGRGARFFR